VGLGAGILGLGFCSRFLKRLPIENRGKSRVFNGLKLPHTAEKSTFFGYFCAYCTKSASCFCAKGKNVGNLQKPIAIYANMSIMVL
jgi:hypothetical protein